ncbi:MULTISPECIES: hypothetical protein [unclassified Pseudomonas]|uniref:hypothetical protein n=1 Tax=unclassified Pseudomonas TaxID=196821 RepID=UPI000C87E527|nr:MULTISPECIES: hypothetical protein [unclassified Pseudomonas]PMX29272.1 hypothetical protein C1Y23_01620 [Pseudomonas sp. GW460-12]PMX36871.1 hypothetical protein C1Y24_04300 [Pseudomonas sp. MPR-R2A4]PMX43267.1 hypothetical protein C1Y26_03170 [Pseudomonas sp. MPR-R2A7]PMX53332.1 hypothetical protein C1Y17_14315 [Pseudomonas sp. MPR-R2A6]PMX93392.1 hypothetical protein C1Y21_02715 [Pseudomonas sp. MPR-R2A3]
MKRRQISPAALPAIGQPFAGGFYAGRIYFDGAEFALIDAGQEFETAAHWWDHEGPRPRIRGATHRFDGMANTLAMSAEGSTIATKVLGMNIRGTWGWHIPSIEELNLMRGNLLQLPDWNHRICEAAPQAFRGSHQYWSSTQKENAATAWLMGMYPWAVPDTNWVSGCNGIRPVKVLQIKADAFVHEPSTDIAANVAVCELGGLTASPAVAEVLGQFINEDTGRFYGRTDDLLAKLAMIAGEARA